MTEAVSVSVVQPARRRLHHAPGLFVLSAVVRYSCLGLVALFGVYFAVAVLPGDAASQKLGLGASPDALAALRAEMGLDRPVLMQFASWLADAAQGNWGTSAATGAGVTELLHGPVQRSLALTAIVFVFVGLFGVCGGIVAGMREGKHTDRALSSVALAAICTPEFVLGTALVFLFATVLGWLPAISSLPAGGSVADRPEVLILPALTIGLIGGATLLRQVRAVVATEASRPHIEAALLSGFSTMHVVTRHLLPNALAPIAQAAAMVLPYVVGGAVVVERVFAYPGLGSVLVAAIPNRDVNVAMGSASILIAVSVFGYAVADFLGRGHRA